MQPNKNRKTKNRELFYAAAYFIISFLISAAISFYQQDKSNLAIGILFFSLFLPLELFGYYQYRRFLNKHGVKTSNQAKQRQQNDTDSFIEEITTPSSAISTNIFLNKKNKALAYALNFFADFFINIIFFVYAVAVLVLSGIFVWGVLKLFGKIN